MKHLEGELRSNGVRFLPEGETVKNLNFIEVTPERKEAVRNFVKCRVNLTLTHEQKRNFEQATLDRINARFDAAGERLRETLQSACSPQKTEAQEGTTL